jgi:hypothetical protein
MQPSTAPQPFSRLDLGPSSTAASSYALLCPVGWVDGMDLVITVYCGADTLSGVQLQRF